MPRPVTVVITVQDGKGAFSQMRLNLPNQDIQSIADSTNEALARVSEVDSLITGRIVQLSLILDIDLPPGLDAFPAANSDGEEGGHFVFGTSDGYSTSTTLPTIDESLFLPGLKMIDVSNPNVQDFIMSVISNHVDSRGDSVVSIDSADQLFKKSRGGAG